MALLLYSNVDKEEPEFFSYLKKTLENLEKKHSQSNQNISKQEFVRIFTEPEISYQNLKIDEMASVFKFKTAFTNFSVSFSKFSTKIKEALFQPMISCIFTDNLRIFETNPTMSRNPSRIR